MVPAAICANCPCYPLPSLLTIISLCSVPTIGVRPVKNYIINKEGRRTKILDSTSLFSRRGPLKCMFKFWQKRSLLCYANFFSFPKLEAHNLKFGYDTGSDRSHTFDNCAFLVFTVARKFAIVSNVDSKVSLRRPILLCIKHASLCWAKCQFNHAENKLLPQKTKKKYIFLIFFLIGSFTVGIFGPFFTHF